MKDNLFPYFDFYYFFSGKIDAFGNMILFYPKKRIKNLKISFIGKLKKNFLFLNERYKDNDGLIYRHWKFKKISKNTFYGYEKDLVGKALINIKKNHLIMNYKYKINYKGFSFLVKVNDCMFLIDTNTLLNKTRISKFGFLLAESLLIYKKL